MIYYFVSSNFKMRTTLNLSKTLTFLFFQNIVNFHCKCPLNFHISKMRVKSKIMLMNFWYFQGHIDF